MWLTVGLIGYTLLNGYNLFRLAGDEEASITTIVNKILMDINLIDTSQAWLSDPNLQLPTAHIGIQHVTDWADEAVKALGFEHVLSGHLAPEVAEGAIQFLEQSHERPFFLNIGFFEPQRMIRTERFKLIWNAEVDIINVPADIMHSPIYPQMIDILTVERPPFELYDLMKDPDEIKNLAGKADYTDIFDDLRQRLLQWMQDTNDPILEGPIASPYYTRAMRKLKGNQNNEL